MSPRTGEFELRGLDQAWAEATLLRHLAPIAERLIADLQLPESAWEPVVAALNEMTATTAQEVVAELCAQLEVAGIARIDMRNTFTTIEREA